MTRTVLDNRILINFIKIMRSGLVSKFLRLQLILWYARAENYQVSPDEISQIFKT